MDFYLSKKHIRLSHQPVYPTMFVKNIQMYGVQKSGKCVCKSKNLNLDLFATLRLNSLVVLYHYCLAINYSFLGAYNPNMIVIIIFGREMFNVQI